MSFRVPAPPGTFHVRARDLALAKEATDLACASLENRLEETVLCGRRVVFKAGPLRGKAAWRHGLRALFGLRPPRLAEFANLEWLRARLFHAPRPVAAGALWSRGALRYQFLATERIDAVPLDRWLEESREDRARVLSTIARETARLHALSFVHRDLYLRNLLWNDEGPWFLDAWRGGARPGLRGPATDLACFLLQGTELLEHEEIERFLRDYLDERERQGRPAARPSFLDAVARERERLRRRLERRPSERRGQPVPGSWSAPL